MRCRSCDSLLRIPDETSRKYVASGEYVDLCNHCFGTIRDAVRTTEQKRRKYYQRESDEDEVQGL